MVPWRSGMQRRFLRQPWLHDLRSTSIQVTLFAVLVKSRRVARNLQWRGMFWRSEIKQKWFSLGIGTIFWPKLGEDQKKSFNPGWVWFIRPHSFQIQSQSSRILIANANGGRAIFAFSAKIGLKSAKNEVVCILCMPMGRAGAPPPCPPGCATGWKALRQY